MAKKANTTIPSEMELEVLYADGFQIPDAIFRALSRAVETGEPAAVGNDRGPAWPFQLAGAAVQKIAGPRETEILFAAVPRKGKPEHTWHAVARYDVAQRGKHTFIEARRFLAPLTARTLGMLERTIGAEHTGDYLGGYGEPKPGEAFVDVTAEVAAAYVMPGQSAACVVYAYYRGLWFPVAKLENPGQIVHPKPQPRATRVAIV